MPSLITDWILYYAKDAVRLKGIDTVLAVIFYRYFYCYFFSVSNLEKCRQLIRLANNISLNDNNLGDVLRPLSH